MSSRGLVDVYNNQARGSLYYIAGRERERDTFSSLKFSFLILISVGVAGHCCNTRTPFDDKTLRPQVALFF
jgi:hypothetical protein